MSKPSIKSRILAGAAAATLLLGGGVATAAPASASTAWERNSYALACNYYGTGCKKALIFAKGYSYADICADFDCTRFQSFAAHPSPSKISGYSRTVYLKW